MGRQSSSPDSLTFENIYQLPFFVSAVPPANDGFSVCTTKLGGVVMVQPPEAPSFPREASNVVDVVPNSRVRASLPIVFPRFILTVAGEPASPQG
jgi:hypothetical protein